MAKKFILLIAVVLVPKQVSQFFSKKFHHHIPSFHARVIAITGRNWMRFYIIIGAFCDCAPSYFRAKSAIGLVPSLEGIFGLSKVLLPAFIIAIEKCGRFMLDHF